MHLYDKNEVDFAKYNRRYHRWGNFEAKDSSSVDANKFAHGFLKLLCGCDMPCPAGNVLIRAVGTQNIDTLHSVVKSYLIEWNK